MNKSNLSFAIVLTPEKPLRSLIAKASLEITQLFDNQNIIDEERFPAHLSLYLGGTNENHVNNLWRKVNRVIDDFSEISITAIRASTSRGFIKIDCYKSKELMDFVNRILIICKNNHKSNPSYRPHLLERWNNLSEKKQKDIVRYGTYKTSDEFNPHMSIAHVDESNCLHAIVITKNIIKLPLSFAIETLQLVDIGHHNEKWKVIKSVNLK